MSLHARVVARAAGATGDLIDRVAAEIAAIGETQFGAACELLQFDVRHIDLSGVDVRAAAALEVRFASRSVQLLRVALRGLVRRATVRGRLGAPAAVGDGCRRRDDGRPGARASYNFV